MYWRYLPVLATECQYTPDVVNELPWMEFLVLGARAEQKFQLTVAAAGNAAAMKILGG